MICPCCGGPIQSIAPVKAIVEAFGQQERRIVECLAAAYPRIVTNDSLVWAMYQGEDEPDNASRVLHTNLSNLRRKLVPYGWAIPIAPGGTRGEYRIEPLTAENAPRPGKSRKKRRR